MCISGCLNRVRISLYTGEHAVVRQSHLVFEVNKIGGTLGVH